MSSLFLGVEVKVFLLYAFLRNAGSCKTAHENSRGKRGVGAAIQNRCSFVTRSPTNSSTKEVTSTWGDHLRDSPGGYSGWQTGATGDIKKVQNTLVSEAVSEFSKNSVREAGGASDLQRCHPRPTETASVCAGFSSPRQQPPV